jgi:hypothetical protein
VRYCCCLRPPGHFLCNIFTLTTTLALVGAAAIGTGDGLDYRVVAWKLPYRLFPSLIFSGENGLIVVPV